MQYMSLCRDIIYITMEYLFLGGTIHTIYSSKLHHCIFFMWKNLCLSMMQAIITIDNGVFVPKRNNPYHFKISIKIRSAPLVETMKALPWLHECPKTAKVFSPTVIVARKVALQQELSLFKNFKDI